MKTNHSIKKEDIIKFDIVIDKENYYYTYKKYPKILELFFSSGVYYVAGFMPDEYYGSKPPEDSFLKDGKVFYKPHLEISIKNNKDLTVYFNDINSLNKVVDNIKDKSNPWLNIV